MRRATDSSAGALAISNRSSRWWSSSSWRGALRRQAAVGATGRNSTPYTPRTVEFDLRFTYLAHLLPLAGSSLGTTTARYHQRCPWALQHTRNHTFFFTRLPAVYRLMVFFSPRPRRLRCDSRGVNSGNLSFRSSLRVDTASLSARQSTVSNGSTSGQHPSPIPLRGNRCCEHPTASARTPSRGGPSSPLRALVSRGNH